MALAQARAGDARKARVGLHISDRGRAAIAHGLAQSAYQLIGHGAERTLVWDAPLDALGNQPGFVSDAFLEVPVFAVAAAFHRADGPHAAIVFIALTLGDDEFARAFIDSGEQATKHDGIGSSG